MRDCHRYIIADLVRAGIKPRLTTTGGSHVRVEWEVGGKQYSVLVANTPSDHRATHNSRARIRRKLKEIMN